LALSRFSPFEERIIIILQWEITDRVNKKEAAEWELQHKEAEWDGGACNTGH